LTKVIITHDVDHLSAWEHWWDLMLPKFWLRSCIEFGLRRISARELALRITGIFENRLENIRPLMAFDAANQVPSTFFIGVGKGRQLSYDLDAAAYWVNAIKAQGFEVGVHGIEYNHLPTMKNERNTFSKLGTTNRFGIRMHTLAQNETTLKKLAQAGYAYDSTTEGMRDPYKIGHMWEFPLQLMDCNIFCDGRRWQTADLNQARTKTIKMIEEAEKKNLKYFSILFHDFYFCDGFTKWKEWYMWLIEFFKSSGVRFINFSGAIAELECNEKEAMREVG
jgi:hypothetical protein